MDGPVAGMPGRFGSGKEWASMVFTTENLVHLLIAIGLLVSFGHVFGWVFRRFRQPPVIGEILAGLLLGPTILGWIDPGLQESIFPKEGPTRVVMGAFYQLGLLLLMFCSGAEMRTAFQREDRRTAVAITLAGTVLPMIAGLLLLRMIDTTELIGVKQHHASFALVFGIAVAVTSIPVISRILTDLGIIQTPFASIVLSSAIIEDVILYVILSVAIAMVVVVDPGTGAGGFAEMLGLQADTWQMHTYHVAASILFFGVMITLGAKLFTSRMFRRLNPLHRGSPVANMLVFMFLATIAGVYLGVAPMLGAFAAGLAVGKSSPPAHAIARDSIKSFSYAFFVPIYFTIVGLNLNLRTEFAPLFFVGFLAVACLVKASSVFLGAKVAGETNMGAWNLAVAMNARGGPGIVLASVAFEAGIVSKTFYSSLVMLAIVTSLMAGSWLDLVVRKKWPLR
jgi:Kef-type K+ transport system membrane component KefB